MGLPVVEKRHCRDNYTIYHKIMESGKSSFGIEDDSDEVNY